MAKNCRVDPTVTLGLLGITAMDCKVALLTVKGVLADTLPDVAETVMLPTATAEAKPLEPGALLSVATAVSVEPQVTELVRFCVVLSE